MYVVAYVSIYMSAYTFTCMNARVNICVCVYMFICSCHYHIMQQHIPHNNINVCTCWRIFFLSGATFNQKNGIELNEIKYMQCLFSISIRARKMFNKWFIMLSIKKLWVFRDIWRHIYIYILIFFNVKKLPTATTVLIILDNYNSFQIYI